MMTKHKLTVSLPTDTEILMTRSFNAPKNLVYECFTDAEMVGRWLGCGMARKVVAESDLRIGGVWRWLMDMGEYGEHEMFGQMLDIQPGDRVVRTFVYNVPQIRECVCTETATFVEENGVTNVTILIKHLSKENRDGHVGSGMEDGAGKSYDGLDELLNELQR